MKLASFAGNKEKWGRTAPVKRFVDLAIVGIGWETKDTEIVFSEVDLSFAGLIQGGRLC